MNLDRLIMLHDAMKNHPYRDNFDSEYKKNYSDMIWEITKELWDVVKDSGNQKIIKGTNFIHDYRGSAWGLPNPNHVKNTEHCLQTIHTFILTGDINEYYTYYNGCNISKYMSRSTRHLWNEELQRFVPQYDKEELRLVIVEAQEKYDSSSEGNKKWLIHTLEYYKKVWDWLGYK